MSALFHSMSEEEFSSWLDHATSSGSNKFGYKCISSPGSILSCGVAILYNPSYDVVSCSRDQDGRLLCAEFSKDGSLIQLVNIYAPNTAKPASTFFESLYQVLDPDTPTVLCGDFNTVVDSIKDRFGCNSNMLGLSTLWYLCSFSVIPEAIIKAVNGEVFPFVWRKKREWLSRTSVTQRPNQGGLGVVDVHRKMLSLHVLWVKRLIFRPNLPWTSFFSQYLKGAFPGRSVHQILIWAVPPKYAMDALPTFYRSVLTAWFALKRKFVDNEYVICGPRKSVFTLEQLSASFVYDTLSHQHRKQLRCVEKYANWGLSVDWSNVWLSLLLWRFIRPVRDTSWLIAHGILPTADRLLRFGIQVDPLCHCGRTESLIHLFTDCPFAIQLIDWYFSVYKRFRPQSQRPSKCDLLVGYGKNVKVPPVFPCLLGIIRHHI